MICAAAGPGGDGRAKRTAHGGSCPFRGVSYTVASLLITSGYVPELLPISTLIYTVHILASGMHQGDLSHLPL